jgi:hypothetical protein
MGEPALCRPKWLNFDSFFLSHPPGKFGMSFVNISTNGPQKVESLHFPTLANILITDGQKRGGKAMLVLQKILHFIHSQ